MIRILLKVHFSLRCLLLIGGLVLIPRWNSLSAQAPPAPDPPEREFRGVWVTTVFHIDYPQQPSPSAIALREEWKNLLDQLKKTGFNAVIVQVRGAGDALYPSRFAPWSAYLTGKQGLPPDRGFDPLEFMIQEAHRRGMEFHAWMNPYRVSMNLDTIGLHRKHIFYRHRDWLLTYANRLYLNPALPEVWHYLTEVVAEVVANYEVDAIHFDDYFYPYPQPGIPFPDSLDFQRYRRYDEDRDAWRRRNVSSLIERLADRIRQEKPWVKFGISPFGVWRNRDQDPTGSPTRAGTTSYDHLHADVLRWLEKGWIDYVMPQVYWPIGAPSLDHAGLVDWWADHTYGRQLIIGHAAYKVGNTQDSMWQEARELPRQVAFRRKQPASAGSSFFNASSVLENRLGIRDSLSQLFRRPALPPVNWKTELPRPAPARVKKVRFRKGAVLLRWKAPKVKWGALPAYYALYRQELNAAGEAEKEPVLLEVMGSLPDEKKYRFWDRQTRPGQSYLYFVTGLNRQHEPGSSKASGKVKDKRKPNRA